LTGAGRIRAPATTAEWEAYFHCRWVVLRHPWQQPEGSERDDLEETAVHRAAFLPDGTLVAVGRLHTIAEGEGQVRYMAVLPAHQGGGWGGRILAALEEAARAGGLTRLRLNARDSVVPFYRRHGYLEAGPGPTLYDTITHTVMTKRLEPGCLMPGEPQHHIGRGT
jgi:GNAT superfamily N-acetyltransferase